MRCPAPSVKKPGKRATDQQRADFKAAKKQHNLSRVAVREFERLRRRLDQTGHRDLWILGLGDGSYTDSTVLPNLPERMEYLGRGRGDMVLHAPAPAGGRKVYGARLPTLRVARGPDCTRARSRPGQRGCRSRPIVTWTSFEPVARQCRRGWPRPDPWPADLPKPPNG